MPNLLQSLLLVIARATDRELARQVQYLKIENQILRGKLPKRITITAVERRRLVRYAQRLGPALHRLTTIVAPGTLLRWIREEKKTGKTAPAPRGRRRTPAQIRRLILKLAKENQWGYTRILGELKKLGIRSLSRNTVKRILKDAGYDPGPQRGEGTWDEFLKRHAASLWQTDFFSRKVLTPAGFRDVFVLVFLHVQTRRVIVSPPTRHPDEAWVVAQARAFVAQARDQGLRVGQVLCDRDAKFSQAFADALRSQHVRLRKLPYRAPNTNAYVERFIQSIQQECLDHFVICGLQHLQVLCREFLAYYHQERPHQGLDNRLPGAGRPRGRSLTKCSGIADEVVPLHEVRCQQRLGGLLKSYSRAA